MNRPVPLDLVVTSAPARQSRVAVAGDLDAFTVAQLVSRLRVLLVEQEPEAIRLDLSGVPFVDTTAAGELSRFHRVAAAAGCAVSVAAAGAAAWWLFGSLGLSDRFRSPDG